ncbi:paraquat-inducible protein A [Pontibacterium sp.]|uniref:paraquat-inducible protein A n=1 Tax=Pontibacterium sp. TaxID=2036026 RepID=UPI0035673540
MNNISPNDAGPVGIPLAAAKRMRWLLILATGLFVAGICLPMITISKFIVVTNSFSVISGVLELLSNGQVLLFAVVACFSIVLPILKIGVLFKLLNAGSFQTPKMKRYLHLMHEYGRWAMLDVMVVAVLIVTVKLDAIASIEVHGGLYVFGASVLLIMLITNKVVQLTTRHGKSAP